MSRSSNRRSLISQLRLWGIALVVVYVVVQFIAFQASLNRIPSTWRVAGESFPDQPIVDVVMSIKDAFDTPVHMHYYGTVLPLDPQDIGFSFDPEATADAFRQARAQSASTGNFLRHLIFQSPEALDLPIVAHYSEEQIRSVLSDIALEFDKPAQAPLPDLDTMSLQPGQAGYTLDIASSVKPVSDALTSLKQRDADLIVVEHSGIETSIADLDALLKERLKSFRGNASVFLKDLQTGDEILINSQIAYSGMSLMKIPIMGEIYRQLNQAPDIETTKLLTETLGADSGNFTANLLLRQLGNGDSFAGVEQLTSSMRFLGLVNTFMATPYDQEIVPPAIVTEANSRQDVWANPDPFMQTTPTDIGLLLEMIYQCHEGGGALMVAYPGQFTSDECAQMIDLMKQNVITDAEGVPTLLRGGLPSGTPFAHKHGWDYDTRADASIAFTPGGNFVLVVFLNTPQEWVDWTLANDIMVDMAHAAYNYFNPGETSAQLP